MISSPTESANKTLCYKTLLAKFIVVTIFVAVILSFAKILISSIFYSEDFKLLVNAFREVVKDFINISSENAKESSILFKDALKTFLLFVKSKVVNIIWVSVIIVLLIELMKFSSYVIDYVIGVNINQHMSSMCHSPFFTTMFENFKNACRYAGFKVLVTLMFNVISIVLVFSVFISLIDNYIILTLSLTMFLTFAFISLRLALLGGILPKMICENIGAFKSFKECFSSLKLVDLWNKFSSYFIICVVVYVVSILSAIVTYNLSFIITIPYATILFISLKFVDYYSTTQKKYYITFDDIIVPKLLRQNDENLLNDVDI